MRLTAAMRGTIGAIQTVRALYRIGEEWAFGQVPAHSGHTGAALIEEIKHIGDEGVFVLRVAGGGQMVIHEAEVIRVDLEDGDCAASRNVHLRWAVGVGDSVSVVTERIDFTLSNGECISIYADGRVEYPDGIPEAAKLFWVTLRECFPDVKWE